MKRAIRPRRMSDLPALPAMFDRMFDESLLPRSVWGEEILQGIPVDMYEEEGAIVVRAAVPGLKREDLHVEVSGDQLRIWGERKDETEREEEDYYLRENRYGRVERRMLLPHDVDAEAAEAAFEDGVLMLTLPILEGDARHEIEIHGKE